MDPKVLKKLVKTCRELGVLNYKGPDFEFTLSHDAPIKQSKKPSKPAVADRFETDDLSADELMFWSASGGRPFGVEDEQGA